MGDICAEGQRKVSIELYVLQVSTFEDVQSAAVALVSASYKRWLEHEQRTDDITAIIIVFQNLGSGAQPDQCAAAAAAAVHPVRTSVHALVGFHKRLFEA